jgi:hypothetical protein
MAVQEKKTWRKGTPIFLGSWKLMTHDELIWYNRENIVTGIQKVKFEMIFSRNWLNNENVETKLRIYMKWTESGDCETKEKASSTLQRRISYCQ